jgi:hypothetical protein
MMSAGTGLHSSPVCDKRGLVVLGWAAERGGGGGLAFWNCRTCRGSPRRTKHQRHAVLQVGAGSQAQRVHAGAYQRLRMQERAAIPAHHMRCIAMEAGCSGGPRTRVRARMGANAHTTPPPRLRTAPPGARVAASPVVAVAALQHLHAQLRAELPRAARDVPCTPTDAAWCGGNGVVPRRCGQTGVSIVAAAGGRCCRRQAGRRESDARATCHLAPCSAQLHQMRLRCCSAVPLTRLLLDRDGHVLQVIVLVGEGARVCGGEGRGVDGVARFRHQPHARADSPPCGHVPVNRNNTQISLLASGRPRLAAARMRTLQLVMQRSLQLFGTPTTRNSPSAWCWYVT